MAADASPALPARYRAMALVDAARHALEAIERPTAPLAPGELRLRVHACGVCRTDLHIVDGELPTAPLPRVPGHEIVGRIVELGPGCTHHALGDRVGVPWLADTCRHCTLCRAGRENLCADARFTGWSVDGGYAEYAVARDDACFAIPPNYTDEQAAPLLCAGLIGWRALRMLPDDAAHVGLYGFGAAAHLVAQVALAEGRRVAAFTRAGDTGAQSLARRLGVQWAGASSDDPPAPLDGALIFAPVGELVPRALQVTAPGGTVVCGGIHMSDIPSFPYRWLWQERSLKSVANLTRRDGAEFMAFAAKHPLQIATTGYALADANRALDDLRAGRVAGAAVLHCR
jgi:propanol-preferring alcohol dehydrogenase